MYGALWRALPGPTWAKVLQCVALAALVVVVLFGWVFPWVAQITDLGGSASVGAPAGASLGETTFPRAAAAVHTGA